MKGKKILKKGKILQKNIVRKSKDGKRIADGAGVDVSEVTKLIREFTQMQHIMKRLQSKGGLRKMLNMVKDLMPAAGFKMPPQQ